MAAVYPYAQIVHLVLAIIFLGYVFFDVIIFPIVGKKLPKESFVACKQAIGSRAVKIMPIFLLLIILTGGMMMSQHVNSNIGWFETSSQKVLMVKIALAYIIVLGVITSLTCKVLGKPLPFMQKYFHTFVLLTGFTIVILAKVMFMV